MNDTAESRLNKTLFVVEATSAEEYFIWQEWANNSLYPVVKPEQRVNWEQLNGWIITIGELDNRPVVMSVTFNRINGYLVMFWYMCSQVTDSVMAEKWLDENFDGGTRRARTDALNFSHCIHAIREAEKNNVIL